MEYITTKEAAGKWDITERRVQVLCRQGKIDGVFSSRTAAKTAVFISK